jgi:hypothetical protein
VAVVRGIHGGERDEAAPAERGCAIETCRLQEHTRSGFDDFAVRGRHIVFVQHLAGVVFANQQICPASPGRRGGAVAELDDDGNVAVFAAQGDRELGLLAAGRRTDVVAAQCGIGKRGIAGGARIGRHDVRRARISCRAR